MLKKISIIGIFAGFVSGILWGFNDVYINIFSSHFSLLDITLNVVVFSLVLAFIQDSFSSIFILFYKFFFAKHNFSRLNNGYSLKVFMFLFLAAIFAGPLGMVSGIMAISYAGPIYAGVITSSYPIVALVLAFIFLKEAISISRSLGIIFVVVAVVLISISGESYGSTSNLDLGILFAFIAAFGWGAESTMFSFAIKFCKDTDTSVLLAIRQLISSTCYLVCLLYIYIIYNDNFIAIKSQFVHLNILFICVLTAMSSYMAYYYAIKKLGAAIATTFNASFIFWAAFFSIVLGIASITLSFVFLSFLLILGIYLAIR